jgi:heterotetrameric sarcosine oxidase delta subunit
MLIPCPYCGERPSEEFTSLGDASVKRPTSLEPDAMDAWYDYVYLRDNPKGRMQEYWHHGGGCRAWLVVERDTATHEVFSARPARAAAAKG